MLIWVIDIYFSSKLSTENLCILHYVKHTSKPKHDKNWVINPSLLYLVAMENNAKEWKATLKFFHFNCGNEVKGPHLATEKCGGFSLAGNHMSRVKFITLERSRVKGSWTTMKYIAIYKYIKYKYYFVC